MMDLLNTYLFNPSCWIVSGVLFVLGFIGITIFLRKCVNTPLDMENVHAHAYVCTLFGVMTVVSVLWLPLIMVGIPIVLIGLSIWGTIVLTKYLIRLYMAFINKGKK